MSTTIFRCAAEGCAYHADTFGGYCEECDAAAHRDTFPGFREHLAWLNENFDRLNREAIKHYWQTVD